MKKLFVTLAFIAFAVASYAQTEAVSNVVKAVVRKPGTVAEVVKKEEPVKPFVQSAEPQREIVSKEEPQYDEPLPVVISRVDQNIPKTDIVNDSTFAFIICNEKYESLASVPYAVHDGEVFAEYCEKTLGLPANHVSIWRNATYGNMKKAIKRIQSLSAAFNGDIYVIFYYAGHGAPDDATKQAYLLPIDVFNVDPEICISLSDLYQSLADMNIRKTTIFLDACFSGSARSKDGRMLASARGVALRPKKEAPQGQMVVFSAATDEQTALPYAKEGHGLFTYYLLDKLQSTAGDVTLEELGEYVSSKVLQQSVIDNDKPQQPTISASDDATDWQSWKLK